VAYLNARYFGGPNPDVVVPVPATWALLALGLTALTSRKRQRRSAVADASGSSIILASWR
jgi:hypothetical protein